VPALSKANRRDAKRLKRLKMPVTGRGLITSPPNWEKRRRKQQRDKYR